MSTAAKYVAAVYGIVFVAVLVYVVIMAAKLTRLQRELAELAERARRRVESTPSQKREPERVEVG